MKKFFLFAIIACLFAACGSSETETATTNTAPEKGVQPLTTEIPTKPSPKKTPINTAPTTATNSDFKWYTMQEAIEANAKEPKKIVIDMYTSWCGWCKVMDAKTFSNPQVQDYLDEHFYAVKFNAERKDKFSFKGEEFEFMNVGRRGIHGLANKLLNGRAGYPTLVYLDEQMNPIRNAPGFKQVEQLMPELKYAAENAYKTQTIEQFRASL